MPLKFNEKWESINKSKSESDEKKLYVELGEEPATQRQLNLFYYFLFIKKVLQKTKARDVLEIGSGRGTMSLFLANYLGLNLSLLDSSRDAMEIAKKDFKLYNCEARYNVGDALNSGLESESFDSIVSIGLAEHIDDVEQLYSEQFRLLRRGGVMISLNFPKKLSIQNINLFYKLFLKIFEKNKSKTHSDYYRNKLTPKDYSAIAKKQGFENVEAMNVCPFPIFAPLAIEKDKKVTRIFKLILRIRKLFQTYPYKTNYFISQGHFLIAYKKK